MPDTLAIYYDDEQEGMWFQGLHKGLAQADLLPITGARNSNLKGVLVYDRPDIILAHNGSPILVVERTIEVPSGHNVGQRFARLAAAAESGIPSVYFGPYAARKHGGATEGPRYMNLRLFSALQVVTELTHSPVTTINWPVDENYEVRRGPEKDFHVTEYLDFFWDRYWAVGLPGLNRELIESAFHEERLAEREEFARTQVRDPHQYDDPPPSVHFLSIREAVKVQGIPVEEAKRFDELMMYEIGATYLRADPYTGMAMLYRYLYVLGQPDRKRGTILHMPGITIDMWRHAADGGRERKDVRLFRLVSDGILFRDGYLAKEAL